MRARETRGGKQTREWIVETAVKLFNEHGTQAVSTKRIAKEMGISPGNLYYHFKNKEEIIRAIVANKFEDFAENWDDDQIPPLKKFLDSINNILGYWQAYRFFKKELVVLLGHDPELKTWYHSNKREVFQKYKTGIEALIASGVLRMPDDPSVPDALITISWIIGEYWLNFLDINNEPATLENLRKGLNLILQVWHPYLTREALDEIKRLSAEQE